MIPVQEILVNPKDIKKMSYIAGCANTRKRRIFELAYKYTYPYLYGDWDLTEELFDGSLTFSDYQLFKSGKKSSYNWANPMVEDMKNNGYIQDPKKRYIEVGLGRTGELFMVDGRHRLFLAQEYGIKIIPVNVVYIHPDYNFGNLDIIQNSVIPIFLYDLIVSKWPENTTIYHHWGTINHRYNLVKKYLPLLKGKNVLEIGANSGMMMWSIMNHANFLIELEPHDHYYKQCLITRNCLYKSRSFFNILLHRIF